MEFAETASDLHSALMTPPHTGSPGGEDFFILSEVDPMVYIYLAVGGVIGTLARAGFGVWIYSWAGTYLPWGTFVINLLGSFFLGFLSQAFQIAPVSPEVRSLLTVGFCGAFTTFSTFSFETVALIQEGALLRAALYAFGSIGFGVLAIIGGMTLATGTLRFGG
jgi:CrcB protein